MYYKIVYNKRGKLYSCNLHHRFEPNLLIQSWAVIYTIGEWVYPRQSATQLMCFEDLEQAKDFKGDAYNDLELYECEVLNPSDTGFWVPLITLPHFIDQDYDNFLRNNTRHKSCYKHGIFCDAIKLTKRIEK